MEPKIGDIAEPKKRAWNARPKVELTPLVYRLDELMATVKMSRTAIETEMERGDFPMPIRLGSRHRGWVCSEIQDWIEQRRTERDTLGREGLKDIAEKLADERAAAKAAKAAPRHE